MEIISGPFFPHSASFSETSHPHAYVYSFVLLRHAEVLLFTLTPTPEGGEYLWPSSLRLRLFQLTVTLTLSPEGGKYLQMSALPVPMLGQVYVKMVFSLGFLHIFVHKGVINGAPVEAKRSFSKNGVMLGYLGQSWAHLGPSLRK